MNIAISSHAARQEICTWIDTWIVCIAVRDVNKAYSCTRTCTVDVWSSVGLCKRRVRVEMAGRATTMGFLGAGQMATALARGFVRAGKSTIAPCTCQCGHGSML